MAELPRKPTLPEIAFESFGARIRVVCDGPGELERIAAVLPPGARACPPEEARTTFVLESQSEARYRLSRNLTRVAEDIELGTALEVLEREIRLRVALDAPDFLFVHAGAVGHDGRAIVIPGRTFSGKTTLVAALVRAGARYYSDEFAVFDEHGLVHPFAKPLSLRENGPLQVDRPVAALGGVAGDEPLPLGGVVVTTYDPQAEWRPRRLSPGDAVLALLSNTVPARSRPDLALSLLGRSIEGAWALESDRGEADRLAPWLLDYASRSC
jgi:hypothetical protein